MRLTYDDPDRPRARYPLDRFVINDRTDGGSPIVHEGESFEVSDRRARRLLASHYPRLKAATT